MFSGFGGGNTALDLPTEPTEPTESEITGNEARQQAIARQLQYSILSDSTVVFLQGNDSDETILGSGTLVSIGDTTAILTADHVLRALPRPPEPVRMFFPTSFYDSPGSTPRASKTIEYSEKKRIGRGTDEATGPDLGLLIVHKSDIPSTKTFYSLTKHRSRVLTDPRPNDVGVWVIVGAPAEWTVLDEPDARFVTVNQQRVLMGLTDVNIEFERDGFDYLDIAVSSNSRSGSPIGFGGCSGGGLWHIDLNKTASGEIIIGDPILSGVVFYQCYPSSDRDGMIRCHGRKSIYQRVIQALQS